MGGWSATIYVVVVLVVVVDNVVVVMCVCLCVCVLSATCDQRHLHFQLLVEVFMQSSVHYSYS